MSTLSVTTSQRGESLFDGDGRTTSAKNDSALDTHLVDDLASEGGDYHPAEKKKTEFVPFNLTKAKPKLIPAPEAIKREIKANPVPKQLFKKNLADIEEDKKQRRMATVNAVKNEYE